MRIAPTDVELVIFDVFNTLVYPAQGQENTFVEALTALGIPSSAEVMRRLQTASNGLAHVRWSATRDDYLDWTDRTRRLASQRGIAVLASHAGAIVPSLEQWHQATMRAFDDAVDCLERLRASGIRVAVCSNWGWDLRVSLEEAGLASLIDVVVASAEAGFRKPHSRIYATVLTRAQTTAAKAIFVGDTRCTDVDGPRSVGMRALHLVRGGQGATTADGGVASLARVAQLLASA
jgi:putative hydrolase of the HAD superfamily